MSQLGRGALPTKAAKLSRYLRQCQWVRTLKAIEGSDCFSWPSCCSTCSPCPSTDSTRLWRKAGVDCTCSFSCCSGDTEPTSPPGCFSVPPTTAPSRAGCNSGCTAPCATRALPPGVADWRRFSRIVAGSVSSCATCRDYSSRQTNNLRLRLCWRFDLPECLRLLLSHASVVMTPEHFRGRVAH